MFAVTALVGLILCAYRTVPSIAFMTTLFGVPLLVAGLCRIRLKETHIMSLAAMYTTAMIVTSLATATQSLYLTFFTDSEGYLIGGGWVSVVAAAILGLVIGIIVGAIDTLLYCVASAFWAVAVNRGAHGRPA